MPRVVQSESSLLGGTDPVSGKLLAHVSRYINPETRKHFALALDIEDPEVSHIEADFPGNSKRIHLEILKRWYDNAKGMNIGLFMDKLVACQRDGYLSNNVWSSMGNYVAPHLIPEPPPAPEFPDHTNFFTFFTSLFRYLLFIWARFSKLRLIKKTLKASLWRRCKNKLSTDWLPSDKAKFFPVLDFYVQVKQRKKVLKARKDTTKNIRNVRDILNIEVEHGGVNIALRGEAGIGKTSSMAMLALDWVTGGYIRTKILNFIKIWNFMTFWKNRLNQFSYVFLVELGHVKDNSTLAQVIMKQHELDGKKVPESQIKSILEGEHGKVLLILDGYDEYKKGTNSEVDVAIENTVGECFLIVTSREGDYMSPETLRKIDGEVEITGFSKENVDKYATKFLEARDAANDFLDKCNEAGILGILRVPIILLMTLVLYTKSKDSLPTSRTMIIGIIIYMIIYRGLVKNLGGEELTDIAGIEDSLFKLGQLAWNAVKNGDRSISKEDVIAISPDLLKLGLLHGDFLEEARLEGQPVMMSYPHKLFLEFFAGYYAVKVVDDDNKDIPFNLIDQSMLQVATFMYGVSDRKLLIILEFVTLIYENFSECHALLESFSEEDSSEINPLYNKFICSMNDYLPRPDVHSMVYMFDESLPVEWREFQSPASDQWGDECFVKIRFKKYSSLIKLLRPLKQVKIESIVLVYISDGTEKVIESTESLELNLANNANMSLILSDICSTLLEGLFSSLNLQQITNVILAGTVHVPRSVFSSLAKADKLKELVIGGGQYNFRFSEELCSLLSMLPNFQSFGLFDEPTQRGGEPISFKEKVMILRALLSLRNLSSLFLCDTCYCGVVAEVHESITAPSRSLQVLVLNNVQLTTDDLRGLEELISDGNLLNLSELYLQRNNFTSCKDSLEKLLRTVDDKLPDCQVFVSQDVNLSYNCLKLQTGPKYLDTRVGDRWRINPENT